MQRILLTYLVIGLLLAGCSTLGTSEGISSSLTTSGSAEPTVGSTPWTPESGFSLPQVTPVSGWIITYRLDLDILFQHPVELQNAKSNSAPYEFAGPNGSYLHFSDTPIMPAILDTTVEKTCQKEFEYDVKAEKLGLKPYGEHPQLITLQIDSQPACLIFPSADQNVSFQKRAFLIVGYPKNLSLDGTPRYLSVIADRDHIQSIVETIRFLPRTDQPIDPLPQAVTFIPTLSESLTLKNQNVISITLDETYIYWTIYEQQDTIFRAPLKGGGVEKFITSKFKGGNVVVIPPVRGGDWLIYLDNDDSAQNAAWELQAKNLRDGSKKVLLRGIGDQASALGLNISVADDWVAWSRTTPNAQGTCEESILGLNNLRTNEQIELNRICTDQYMWSIVGLSNQTLVAEQDFPTAKGGGSGLYLFENFRSGEGKAITTTGRDSTPRISFPWIVWKDALRFSWGHVNSIYDLGNKTQRVIRVPGEVPPDPRLAGQWLYWLIENSGTNSSSIYLYDLRRQQVWNIPSPKEGVLSTVAVYGQWIAWSRASTSQTAIDSVLEWGELP